MSGLWRFESSRFDHFAREETRMDKEDAMTQSL